MTTTRQLDDIRGHLTRLENKLDLVLQHLGIDWESGVASLDLELLQLLRYGKKLKAIKLYRQKTGASLAEAKAHVDQLG